MKYKLLYVLTLISILLGCSTLTPEQNAPPKKPIENIKKQSSSLISPGYYQNNGVYMAKAYVSGSALLGANLDSMLSHFQFDWSINEIYVNVGALNNYGNLVSPPTTSATFLGQVQAYEQLNGIQFKIYAWFNGNTQGVSSLGIHPELNSWRTAFATATDDFVQINKPYTTATRAYDGIMVDFEPNGVSGGCATPSTSSPDRHECTLRAINSLKARLDTTCPTCSIAVSAHKFRASSGAWYWTASQYWKAAQPGYADTIVSMCYDASSVYSPYSTYRDWASYQVEKVLRSVKGIETGGNPPSSDRRVIMAMPAWGPFTTVHPGAENISGAAQGFYDGMARYLNDFSLENEPLMSGGAVYLLHTGYRSGFRETPPECGDFHPCSPSPFGLYDDPNKYYSTVAQDWRRWRVYWLGHPRYSF